MKILIKFWRVLESINSLKWAIRFNFLTVVVCTASFAAHPSIILAYLGGLALGIYIIGCRRLNVEMRNKRSGPKDWRL